MSQHRPAAPADASGSSLRVTRRGKVVAAVLALVLLLGFGQLVKGCGGKEQAAVPPTPSQSTSGPTSATPAASGSVTPSATRTSIMEGMTYSGDKGSGKWTVATLDLPTTHAGKSSAHKYVVKVESNLDIPNLEAARQIHQILDDERSWVGSTKSSFSLVSEPAKADLTILLASPDTTDRMCKPLNVLKTWSCRQGNTVILNADRWRFMTPTYDDLGAYRAYMVNHEVGHYIGLGHLDCPAQGQPAPVMMQQSKSLGGCTTNPWPASSKGR